jgi:hypothetical protein
LAEAARRRALFVEAARVLPETSRIRLRAWAAAAGIAAT